MFDKTCGACHELFGEGGQVGPNLTGAKRSSLDFILINSIAPSLEVADVYKTEVVLTIDGELITGVVAEEDEDQIVLKTAEKPRVEILIDDIEDRKSSKLSLMPPGQLDQLEPQQVLDLIKYLQSTKQVELP